MGVGGGQVTEFRRYEVARKRIEQEKLSGLF